MKIILGSASERKVEIAAQVAKQLFGVDEAEVVGLAVASGVPDTPYDRQTFDGARNRAISARDHDPEAEYWVGLESGLVERYGHFYEESWAAVINKEGREYYGYSSGLKVPDYILKRMKESELEHCEVMDLLEQEFAITTPNETWGNYSGGAIARSVSLEEALRNAWIQSLDLENSFYRK